MNVPGIGDQLIRAREQAPEVFPEPSAADPGRADAAVEGLLLFYGVQEVRTGRRGIDWSGRHLRHQEWPAQLNRFQQLPALCSAYRRSGQEKYAAAARDYIEDWLDEHPPYDPDQPQPAAGDSTLNMSIRLGGVRFPGWLGVLADLMASKAFDEPLAERMVDSVEWQLAWLAGHLPAEGNWRVAALDCLFSQALRLPDRLGRFLPAAAEGLTVEFNTQILDGGVHVERSAGYHDWMCGVFLTFWRLAKRRRDLPLRFDDARVVGMHAYTLHKTKPNGRACGFNDARGGFRTDAAGAARLAAAVRDHQSLLAEAGLDARAPRAGLFTSGGHVFYRTGWAADDLWWAFDAGGFGGGHTHLSRLSLELHNGRRTTLPDPGIFDYEMSNPFAPAGKSTPAHSTMNLNLWNQADVDAELIRAADLPGAVVVQGRYAGGYWPGTYKWRFEDGRGQGAFGVHDRTVVWLKDRAMVVLDCLAHEGRLPVWLHWVSDDVPVELDERRLRLTTGDDEGNVCVQVCGVAGDRVSAGLRRGQKDPYLGWVSVGGATDVRPAPVFQCRFDAPAPADGVCTECATVIVPFTGRAAPQFAFSARAAGEAGREVRLDWPDGRSDRVMYTRRLHLPLRELDDVRTDASLLVLSRQAGEGWRHVAAVGASFVRIGGRDVLA